MPKSNVIIPSGMNPRPADHEISAAAILAEYFSADVAFIERKGDIKSADVLIKGIVWEIKSPTGKGKHNIQHTLKKAVKQSSCIVFDARRSKMHAVRIEHELKYQYALTKSIKLLLLIRKNGEVIAFRK